MKRKMLAVAASLLCMATAMPSISAMADGQKVVTLGADLSPEQKNAVLRYFGVAGQNIQTLTITNDDERRHLGAYVPLEQIGTRTFSCALVCPTTKGGIQVKTANLSWVTSNMIASTLSTSGVVNCDVLAAAPFEVSGTGALTGILMAYEQAVGSPLDYQRKEVATQELITTTNIANNIGQVNATELVNDTKIEIISQNITNNSDIDVVINQVAQEQGIQLSEEDHQLLVDLMDQIAQQNYNYDEMSETLERVETNLNNLQGREEGPVDIDFSTEGADEEAEDGDADGLEEDSILMSTDDSALGENVTFDATDEAALDETPVNTEDDSWGEFDFGEPDIFIENTDDDSFENMEITDDMNGEDLNGEDFFPEEAPAEEIITTDCMKLAEDADQYSATELPAGLKSLHIYVPRTDIEAGIGAVVVYDSNYTPVEKIQISDSSRVRLSSMNGSDLADCGWDAGTKVSVQLQNGLSGSSVYYVALEDDAFITADASGYSAATPSGSEWTVYTAEYGFSVSEPGSGVYAGQTVDGKMVLSGTGAASAMIEDADPSLSFNTAEFYGDEAFTLTCFDSGVHGFSVSFYDADGNFLENFAYTIDVQ